MRRAVYLFLVLVAVLQVCWLGENWMWTTATMVVGVWAAEKVLGPELQHDQEAHAGDSADQSQGGQ